MGNNAINRGRRFRFWIGSLLMIACLPSALVFLVVRSRRDFEAGLTKDNPAEVAFYCIVIALLLIPAYLTARRGTKEHVDNAAGERLILRNTVIAGLVAAIIMYFLARYA